MTRKMLKTIFVIMLILSSLACGSNEKIKQGNDVIIKIEKFKTDVGRLPNNLTELGIKEDESGPIYYQKENESKYIVWFGRELGESSKYDSETKQWK